MGINESDIEDTQKREFAECQLLEVQEIIDLYLNSEVFDIRDFVTLIQKGEDIELILPIQNGSGTINNKIKLASKIIFDELDDPELRVLHNNLKFIVSSIFQFSTTLFEIQQFLYGTETSIINYEANFNYRLIDLLSRANMICQKLQISNFYKYANLLWEKMDRTIEILYLEDGILNKSYDWEQYLFMRMEILTKEYSRDANKLAKVNINIITDRLETLQSIIINNPTYGAIYAMNNIIGRFTRVIDVKVNEINWRILNLEKLKPSEDVIVADKILINHKEKMSWTHFREKVRSMLIIESLDEKIVRVFLNKYSNLDQSSRTSTLLYSPDILEMCAEFIEKNSIEELSDLLVEAKISTKNAVIGKLNLLKSKQRDQSKQTRGLVLRDQIHDLEEFLESFDWLFG